MSYTIITDTSSNIPTRMLREQGLEVLPFMYYIDGKENVCLDTESFDGDAFYDMIRAGARVTTSQITPQQYVDCFEPILRAGNDIIFVSMSSGISGSCASANMAANMLREKYPERKIKIIDTRAASLGEGLVALYAAQLRDGGMDIDKAEELLNDMSQRICQIFTVDDLMHLRRGGRLSNLSAIVGTVLHIKPLLKGDNEGKIVAIAKVRGRKRSIEAIAEKYDKLVREPQQQVVGIAQAGCREDAEYLAQLLMRNNPPKEILTVEYEPVTGSHVGPGALALFFESHEKVRDDE